MVHSIEIGYLKAARFNELLQVSTSIAKIARASVIFKQDIRRSRDDTKCHNKNSLPGIEVSDVNGQSSAELQQQTTGEHLTSATVKVACVDAQSFRPKAIPLSIKGALTGEN